MHMQLSYFVVNAALVHYYPEIQPSIDKHISPQFMSLPIHFEAEDYPTVLYITTRNYSYRQDGKMEANVGITWV